ncbi:TPA: NADPH dehydrogenase [Candidatus Uhrbacteria bacterium]|nr:NADPH dehydrogenase [Candidatus Uhrbacteria bacterium]
MLIIYAHPNHLGHCGFILNQVERQLTDKGIGYEILDLYAMNYDPILHQNEHYTSGNHVISSENQQLQEKIKQTDQFIFIYPSWWNNMPAILKGFIDRVFTNHFAFEYRGRFPVGLLKGKATIFTSTGAKRWVTRWIQGDRVVKILTKDTLRFCGIKTKAYLIDNATKLTDKQKQKIQHSVKKGLQNIM